MMQAVIDEVVEGRWFKEPSPFRCKVEHGHAKLCVITGPNASGKSLLRKVLHNQFADRNVEYIHLSQAARCSSSGLERAFIYGSEADDSTGYNSVKLILKALQTGRCREEPFVLLFDEPEIGCSEETQAAIGARIAAELDGMPELVAAIIITHSRELAKAVMPSNPTHWRLSDDGMTLADFAQRSIEPIDLDALLEQGRTNWRLVQSLINAGKQ